MKENRHFLLIVQLLHPRRFVTAKQQSVVSCRVCKGLRNIFESEIDDSKAATALKRLMTAWADTYVPSGNDVNENKPLSRLILNRSEWIEAAEDGVKRFVRGSLHRDGSSYDLERRYSLRYHDSSLRPPMQLAILAGSRDGDLYRWESEKGGSLKESVDDMVSYAMGEKVHREWVKRPIYCFF